MKKFHISFAVMLGMAAGAQAQPAASVTRSGVTQMQYIDSTGHTVPFALLTPTSGLTTVVFDPSTSAADESNAFGHMQKSWAGASANSQPLQLLVSPGVVSTNFQVQETRVQVPFVVANSTTLQTIPFSQPTYLQTNGHYRFWALLYLNAGGGGSKIDVGGTCNTSNFVAAYKSYIATTIAYGGQLTSFLSGPSGSSTTAQTLIEISGELDVTNGGTFVIQFTQNASNATPSVVLAGSTLTVTQIP